MPAPEGAMPAHGYFVDLHEVSSPANTRQPSEFIQFAQLPVDHTEP
jgi:hypothetical protein